MSCNMLYFHWLSMTLDTSMNLDASGTIIYMKKRLMLTRIFVMNKITVVYIISGRSS